MKNSFLITFLACLLSTSLSAQKNNQNLNISSIQFNSIDHGGVTSKVNHFTIDEKKRLSIAFSLHQPLVAYLKTLAPQLSDEELLNKGNFQFTIKVDEKIAYQENVNLGAGTFQSKTQLLEYSIPLISPQPVDHWGWYLWLRFMKMSGGRDLLSEGEHDINIEVRAYFEDASLQTSPIFAKGNIRMDMAEIPFNTIEVPVQKIAPQEDWQVSADAFNKTKIEALNKQIAQKRYENINGLVVIKNNELLIEEYFNGSKRESLHDVRSVGKSFASTVMGIAIEEGHIKSENMTLGDFYTLKNYKNYSPAKEEVSLKSLLSMSSPFDGNDSDYNSIGNEENMYPTENWVKFTLDLPLNSARTESRSFSYFTAGVVLLGDVLHQSVPYGLEKYAHKKLFAPLEISNYKWQHTPQGVANTAGGIRLRALDFAKYGQLYKNNGKWNGKQIIPQDWIEKSFSKQVNVPFEENGKYGYLFWNKTYTINEKEYEVNYCTGNGGNKIFVFKDLPFVIVITASNYNMPYQHADVDKMMLEYILPAILE